MNKYIKNWKRRDQKSVFSDFESGSSPLCPLCAHTAHSSHNAHYWFFFSFSFLSSFCGIEILFILKR